MKQKSETVVNSTFTDETPNNPEILKAYIEAGKLADLALNFAISQVKVGAKVFDICKAVDSEMVKLCSGVAGSGISFPCAISPNDLICHYSPTASDPELILKSGDLVKIELGIHVNNCPSFVCHSFIIGSASTESEAKNNNLLKAAWKVAQETARDLRPGQILDELTDKYANIPAEFGCNYTQGLMTHVISRNNLAGDKGLIYRPTSEQRRLATGQIVEENEVYLVDVVISSGQYAVARPTAHRTSIFKKSGNVQALRFKTSRQFISEIGNKYGLMAFSLRYSSANEARSRVAIKECLASEVVHSYDVIADLEETACTARFAFTLIVGKDSNTIVTHPNCNI